MTPIYLHVSQGNGHYFPLKSQSSESHNPLLANEDMWEESDDGSEEGSLGESHFDKVIPSYKHFVTQSNITQQKC